MNNTYIHIFQVFDIRTDGSMAFYIFFPFPPNILDGIVPQFHSNYDFCIHITLLVLGYRDIYMYAGI